MRRNLKNILAGTLAINTSIVGLSAIDLGCESLQIDAIQKITRQETEESQHELEKIEQERKDKKDKIRKLCGDFPVFPPESKEALKYITGPDGEVSNVGNTLPLNVSSAAANKPLETHGIFGATTSVFNPDSEKDPGGYSLPINISPAKMATIVSLGFPPTWIQNAKSITQEEYDRFETPNTFVGGYIEDDSKRIHVMLKMKEFWLGRQLRVIGHELGHANDWSTNQHLSTDERYDLLLKILERVEADDRFKSDYVENIKLEDWQAQLYSRAREYWGEIVGQYFTLPNDLPKEDYELVKTQIQKTDPSFRNDLPTKLYVSQFFPRKSDFQSETGPIDQ